MFKGNAVRLARRLPAISRNKPARPSTAAAAPGKFPRIIRKPPQPQQGKKQPIIPRQPHHQQEKKQPVVPRDHPNVPIDEAKSLAQGVISILKEHRQLTSEQLWEVVKLRGEIHSKRYMKRLLRWMKSERLVCTELPDKLAENQVFKLASELEASSSSSSSRTVLN